MLLGAWPHPARGDARLAFVLPRSVEGGATLRLLDAQGRVLRQWMTTATAGPHEIAWDGRDAQGAAAAAGVYFAQLRVAGVERGQRVVFVR
jgi:flagellar hook assembly protein FlgD